MRYGFVIALTLCLLTGVTFGQTASVVPSSVIFNAVPTYTSPEQNVVFSNQWLPYTLYPELTISGTGFSIAKNDCANGAKPSSHCNVFVTYSPTGLEQDAGSLVFAYNNGDSITVSLTGNGITAIPVNFNIKASHLNGYGALFLIDLSALYKYTLNEPVVNIQCSLDNMPEYNFNVALRPGRHNLYSTNWIGRVTLEGCANPKTNWWSCFGYFNSSQTGVPIDPEFAASQAVSWVSTPGCGGN